jgi:hypothetical protein
MGRLRLGLELWYKGVEFKRRSTCVAHLLTRLLRHHPLPPPTPPHTHTPAACLLAAILGGPPELLGELDVVEHALRQTLAADSHTLQIKLPPPGVKLPAARCSEHVAGGAPVVELLGITSIWAVQLLKIMCQVGGAGRAGRWLGGALGRMGCEDRMHACMYVCVCVFLCVSVCCVCGMGWGEGMPLWWRSLRAQSCICCPK